MRIGAYRFSPRPLPSVATLALLLLLCTLGFWQLERGAEKAAIESEYAERMREPAVNLDRGLVPAQADLYRQARARGRYHPELTLLVDNSIRAGRVGYQVVTPLQLSGTGRWVLVDRGWVPLGSTRRRLPEIRTPHGDVTVQGYLARPQRPPLTLGEPPALRPAGLQVVPWLDLQDLAAVLGSDVLPLVLRQRGALDADFVKEWPIVNMSPQRHYGYAFQWFALAAALLLIYLFVNLKRLPAE